MSKSVPWLHHVNLQATDVQLSAAFFRDIVGLPPGPFISGGAAHMQKATADPRFLACFGDDNRGLHIVRPSPTFTRDNNLLHNPTIGGHVAITVPDIRAVMRRLDAAGIVYSDGGTYAMKGMHQIYVYDPAMNLIEMNQEL